MLGHLQVQWWPNWGSRVQRTDGCGARLYAMCALKNTYLTKLDAYLLCKQICFGIKGLRVVSISIIGGAFILICCPRNWSGITGAINGKYSINVNTEVPHALRTNSRPATVSIALSLKMHLQTFLLSFFCASSLFPLTSEYSHVFSKTVHRLSCFVAVDNRGPLYLHGLTLIAAWICNYIHYKIWE